MTPSMTPWGMRMTKRRGLETADGKGREGYLALHLIVISILSLSSDAVVAQVLDELGLSLTDELSSECLHLGPCVNPVTQPPPPSPALLPSAWVCFLIPTLCRPPFHRRLPQCGCQWKESRGCSLRPGGCRRRPGGEAQEPSKGLTACAAPGSQWMARHFHCTFCNKRGWTLVLGLCD